MKVILKQDVHNLGKKNEMVNVSDGYAKNYLIPRGLAVAASPSAINEMKSRQNAEKLRKQSEQNEAKKLQERINGVSITFYSKSGENGKLFGSITSRDIAERLEKEYKIRIDRKKIIMQEAIKSLGTYEIEIKLHTGISATLKVTVEDEAQ